MTNPYSDYPLDGCLFEETPIDAPELLAAPGQALPSRVDLRPLFTPIEDQGKLPSCTANAAVGALEFLQLNQDLPVADLSRLFVWYNSRSITEDETKKKGCKTHHVMAAIMAFGVCPESMWPYQNAMWPTKPTDACYAAAQSLTGIEYARIGLGLPCKAVLAAGLPVYFAMYVAKPIFDAAYQSGRMEVPTGGWIEPTSSHAMLIVGYDDADRTWIVRNSWGTKWGDEGHVHIRYEVMEHYSHFRNYTHQLWTIGALSKAGSGLSLAGVSVEESQKAVFARAPKMLAQMKAGIGEKLDTDLQKAKKGIRDRLRGPGAGGGY